MPELPEVETVRRGLIPHLEGARLTRARIHRADLRWPFPDGFAERLEGATVLRLERRAKYLLAHLDTQSVWVTHLGMTGRFRVDAAPVSDPYHQTAPDPKHRHFQVLAQKDDRLVEIDYYDPRRFGFMLLMTPDELYASRWFQGLGVEPLSDALTPDYLLARSAGRNANLKALLMAQAGIAGLGNIYVCEALWRARLSPDRKARDLDMGQAAALVNAIRSVLEDAIASGGSSISDFAAASGEFGYFQHRFCVYDREGQPCARNDGGIVERKMHQGRSTFFCPVCQV